MATYQYFEPAIAHGGEKVVYRGVNVDTGEQVVVKMLRTPYCAEDQERFASEYHRHTGAQGSGVAKLIDANLDHTPPFYVEEYFPQGSLADHIAQVRASHGQIRTSQALAWTRALLVHLHRLHRANLIHRDIKPHNIMLRGDALVLIDFGIGRTLARPTILQTRAFRGTPAYAAPEQMLGTGVDHRADLYSVGVLLHEMLTGELGCYRSIRYKKRPDVRALLTRLLALKRENRFRSAMAVVRVIDAILLASALPQRVPSF